MLLSLSRILEVKPSWLLAEPSITVEWVKSCRHSALTRTRQAAITAAVTKRLEDMAYLRDLFGLETGDSFSSASEAAAAIDAEAAAERVRAAWALGDGPVSGIVATIEDQGGTIVLRDEAHRFRGLAGWASNGTPVIVVSAGLPAERVRFDVARELGSLVMNCAGSRSAQQEALAQRFAAAFLVPRSAVRRELGAHRQAVSLHELGLLKERWGLGIQEWIGRARDCEVIDERGYAELNARFREPGWQRQEPYTYAATEEPLLLKRLVWRGLEERLIAESDARYLCPELEQEDEDAPCGDELSNRALMRMSIAERRQVLKNRPTDVDMNELKEWEPLDLAELADAE